MSLALNLMHTNQVNAQAKVEGKDWCVEGKDWCVEGKDGCAVSGMQTGVQRAVKNAWCVVKTVLLKCSKYSSAGEEVQRAGRGRGKTAAGAKGGGGSGDNGEGAGGAMS